MKSKIPLLTASTAALLLATTSLQAQNEANHFYIKLDMGGSLQSDFHLQNQPADISFNPGVRAGINFGYNVCRSFAVELETGSIWNSFDKVNGASDPSLNLDLYQVPILGKAIFKLPFENGLTPYIGGGVGGVGSALYVSGPGFDGRDADFVFAYQAEAGVKYAIDQNIEVGVAYKFLGTSAYDFFPNDPFFRTKTDENFSHSILASFVWNF